MSEIINIYPPIIPSYFPAFDKTQSKYRIYFTLSIFNSENDYNFNFTQVRVDYQNTNNSALNSLAGIKFVSAQWDQDNNGYYIELSKDDLKNGFEINQFYKVQIRLCSSQIKLDNDDVPNIHTIDWQNTNQSYYSEWSSVCIIKGIQPPELKLNNFEQSQTNIDSYELRTQTFIVAGSFTFEDNEREYIKSYQINLYEQLENSDLLLYATDTIFTEYNNPNEINYTLKYRLQPDIDYKIEINYETNNMFKEATSISFRYAFGGLAVPRTTISAENDDSEGRIKVTISSYEGTSIYNGFTICRSSNLNDFTIWEDMHNITILNPVDEYIWYDNTVQHGIWYKYSIQRQNSSGIRGVPIEINEPVLASFEHSFLTTGVRQLNIKFNPQINSFSKKIAESVIETIGSKYPFIRRNGSMEYKTFTVSGLISSYMDEENLFTDKAEIYGKYKTLYNEYNEINDIKDYTDILYEKEFRTKVMDFLYDNTVKLFRSPTEGNILVKLSNISFTPEVVLGRMLYNFSATAYEIDDINIDNYLKYNIVILNKITNDEVFGTYEKIGQLYNYSFEKETNIIELILEKEQASYINNEFALTLDKIHWIRIEFNSNSYLINDKSGMEPFIISNNYKWQPGDNIIEGYLVTLNNNLYIIQDTMGVHTVINNEDYLHAGSFFELTEENDNIISSLSFPVDTIATIDYYATFKESKTNEVQIDNTYQLVTYYITVGQEAGSFKPMISLKNILQEKYALQLQNTVYSLVAIEKVLIEAGVGTIVQIKRINDNHIVRYIIDNTNSLIIGDALNTIEELYFEGLHFEKTVNNLPREGEFFEEKFIYSTFEDIDIPKERHAYTINNQRYLYLNSKWFILSKDNDISCEIDAIIDYYCRLQKGERLV